MYLEAPAIDNNGRRPVTDMLVLPSRLDVIAIVRERLYRNIAPFGYSESDWTAIRLCIHEALTNAIQHGNEHDAGKSIVIFYTIDEEQVRIRISDEGRGFNPFSVPDPTQEARLSLPNGRGLWLMKHYMDCVNFNLRGNGVTLIKRRSANA